METPRIEVLMNNCCMNDPCAICGARTDPTGGPDLFLVGTGRLVCDRCAKQHNPDLYNAFRLACVLHNALWAGGERALDQLGQVGGRLVGDSVDCFLRPPLSREGLPSNTPQLGDFHGLTWPMSEKSREGS